MSRITYFTILSTILLAIVTVVNIRGVNASEETRFIRVSVLAQEQADYGVDENANIIPAVSPEIIEDKVHDLESVSKTIKTIEYTTLPVKVLAPEDKNDDSPQSADNPEAEEDPVGDTNSVTNQDQNTNQNNNGNGNPNKDKDKDKDKNKDKDKDKDKTKVKENSSKDDSVKTNDKESKPTKIK